MYLPFADIRGLLRSREEILRDASDGRQFDSIYFAMLIFSCLIALLGLLLNSPAIIIGAMLISPLMGPILACGMALTTADLSLGKKASWNLALSTAEVIFIAAIATWLSPLKDATPEILARTNPNLIDLLVAFFSGLAGTLAMSSRKSGLAILPGVAIATAVMPPLAAVGYGLSTAQWPLARGAFMLFATNVMAIVISAELVFFLVGFRPGRGLAAEEDEHLLVRHRTLIAFAILLALSIPLMRTLLQAAQQVKLRHAISDALTKQTSLTGCRLDNINLRIGRDVVVVEAVVQTPQYIEAPEIEKWEKGISASIGRGVRIDLQQLQIARRQPPPAPPQNRDFVAGGTIRPASPEPPPSPAQQLATLQAKAQQLLQALLSPAGIGPVQLVSLSVRPDGVLLVQLTGIEASPSADATWSVAASALATELRSPVHIAGSFLVSDAGMNVGYTRKAERPSAMTLRSIDKFLTQWKTQPGMRYAFVFAQPPDAITTRRLAFLRSRYPDSVAMPLLPSPEAAAGLEAGIHIQMVHGVERYSPMAPPSISAVAPPAPAAPEPESSTSAE